MSCAASFRNAIVAAALIALAHGLLLRNEEARDGAVAAVAETRASGWGNVPPLVARAPAYGTEWMPSPSPRVKPADALDEMFAFASQEESWKACDQVPGGDSPTAVGGSVMSTCTPPGPPSSPYLVVNTYDDENVMNGGEGDEGLRGFDPLEGGLTGAMLHD